MKKILVVEDEEVVREGLIQQISKAGYQVDFCTNLQDFYNLKSFSFDLVIMDWELPDGEGIDAIKEMRQQGNETPVIMLTARTEVLNKVLGLELGANDYLTKPFEIRELIARIKVQLKDKKPKKNELVAGDLRLDLKSKQVFYKDEEIPLAKMELNLLQFFMENSGVALGRDEILDEVWGFDTFPSTRTVDAHVKILRQKISPEYFETLRGIGYRFKGAQ